MWHGQICMTHITMKNMPISPLFGYWCCEWFCWRAFFLRFFPRFEYKSFEFKNVTILLCTHEIRDFFRLRLLFLSLSKKFFLSSQSSFIPRKIFGTSRVFIDSSERRREMKKFSRRSSIHFLQWVTVPHHSYIIIIIRSTLAFILEKEMTAFFFSSLIAGVFFGRKCFTSRLYTIKIHSIEQAEEEHTHKCRYPTMKMTNRIKATNGFFVYVWSNVVTFWCVMRVSQQLNEYCRTFTHHSLNSDLPNASDFVYFLFSLQNGSMYRFNDPLTRARVYWCLVLFMVEIESNRFSMLLHRCYISVIWFLRFMDLCVCVCMCLLSHVILLFFCAQNYFGLIFCTHS